MQFPGTGADQRNNEDQSYIVLRWLLLRTQTLHNQREVPLDPEIKMQNIIYAKDLLNVDRIVDLG